MRVLIDTNILISAILTNGTPFQAYMKAITHPNTAIICRQNVNELRRIFARKFPRKTEAMEQFLLLALQSVELVAVPEQPVPAEKKIRDAADRPILRAALARRCVLHWQKIRQEACRVLLMIARRRRSMRLGVMGSVCLYR